MYFSVKHIDIKLNQDYADFSDTGSKKTLVLCDGIGEFLDSGKMSKLIVGSFIGKNYSSLSELILDKKFIKTKNSGIIGGSTIICALNENNSDKIKLEYLGNGGIIHLHGDFANNPNSNYPYRYGNIMIPHVSPDGALTKHISHNSGEAEILPSSVELNLNYLTGDILMLFTDGISSLEDNVILKDNENRFWRNETSSIQVILSELNIFLVNHIDKDNFRESLIQFNSQVLRKLKKENFLEDDASLGFIITEKVLAHYKNKKHD